jgi:alcohol dehydrogenase (cytochrome c)/quinohemoprotein ethanol dehydrogenase
MAVIFAHAVPRARAASSAAPSRFEDRIQQADSDTQNWLTTGRTYSEARYSPLASINSLDVSRLGLAWYYDLDTNRGQESTPLAVDGVLYTTSAWSKVQAFDAVQGRLLWQFDPKVPGAAGVKACCDVVNRGAAYWNGKVYVGTIDGRLIALDAKTGLITWSVNTVNRSKSYTITGAPRIVKGKVIIGNGGAEFGVRGYVSAYDARTGRLAWRFYTVPGEPGHHDHAVSDHALAELAERTWDGEWWKNSGGGGGGTVWDSMAYDPDLDLLYIGVGNASYWNRQYRSAGFGDNLFLGSILALRPETGDYVWHYQETPGDQWDYTSTQNMILADLKLDEDVRHVLIHAPKNGVFYVIDAASGKLLSGKPFVDVNWMTGIDAIGRVIVNPMSDYASTHAVWLGHPGALGAHSWQPMAFNRDTGLAYIPVQENAGVYVSDPNFKPKPLGMNVGIITDPAKLPLTPDLVASLNAPPKSYLLAWNPSTQSAKWRAPTPGAVNGGVLTTSGNLVFQGTLDGLLVAYEAVTGTQLWSFDCGSAILAAPITFSVQGRQYISVVVGWGGIYSMLGGEQTWKGGAPRTNKSRVLTFSLDGTSTLPAPPKREHRSPVAAPPQFADPETIKSGGSAFHRTCFVCHGVNGVSAGGAPDLRHSPMLADRSAWLSVVADGSLSGAGMVGFRANFSLAEIDAIRAFIIDQAHKETSGEHSSERANDGKP